MRVALGIEYDGSAFHGWQAQQEGVRTVQTDGICTEVVAPCPGLSEEHALAAQQVALRIAEALDVVGMLAVEMFDTPDGVLVKWKAAAKEIDLYFLGALGGGAVVVMGVLSKVMPYMMEWLPVELLETMPPMAARLLLAGSGPNCTPYGRR